MLSPADVEDQEQEGEEEEEDSEDGEEEGGAKSECHKLDPRRCILQWTLRKPELTDASACSLA